MSDIILKVSPEELKQKANQISEQISSFEQNWKRIEDIISHSRGYWAGEASNSQQRQFVDVSSNMMEIMKRLKEHPQKLLEMAGICQEAEKEVISIAEELPADLII